MDYSLSCLEEAETECPGIGLEQWFTILMLQPFNTVPHANYKIISLLLHNCNFAVMNCNVNICERVIAHTPPKGVMTHKMRIAGLDQLRYQKRTLLSP